jgi:pimeloyl-ACP methyl ester carboxylesterase
MSALPSTQPFRIGIAQPVLDDLHVRLQRTRRTRVLRNGGWDAGSDPDYLDELLLYWRDGYDWRAQERELNRLQHYVVRFDEANLHYVHEVARGSHSTPLLLLHGWPDSFLRYRRVIPLLTGADTGDEHEFNFDVVVPSLPGFAFTGLLQPAEEIPGIGRVARLLHRLMTEVLGYRQFIVAGGDGGSAIAQSLALQFPGSVIAVHLTDIGWHANARDESLSDIERKYVEAAKRKFMQDGAYAAVQASQPRALAAALNDSPAGLASWIVDRFRSWADSPRHLEASFSKDELLTNITIYWVTQTIQSSIYGYLAETRRPSLAPGDFVDRPVGLALFPRDAVGPPPRRLAERSLNVVHWTEMASGGHFGAWERPREFAADLRNFYATLEGLQFTPAHHEHQRPSL